MKIHRVKHSTIPVSAFKPDKTNGHRSKVLRWFQNEHLKQPDCSLMVTDEYDGKFVLWTISPAVLVGTNVSAKTEAIELGRDSLAQSIVDKIEVAPVSDLTQDYDFVIFEDSPKCREECQHKG